MNTSPLELSDFSDATPRRRRGRPVKFTRELQDKVVRLLTRGCYIESVAVLAGVHRSTIHGWIKRGQAGEAPYARFAAAILTAEATSEVALLRVISQAADSGDWRAAAWRLERSFPARWRPCKTLQAFSDEQLAAAVDNFSTQ